MCRVFLVAARPAEGVVGGSEDGEGPAGVETVRQFCQLQRPHLDTRQLPGPRTGRADQHGEAGLGAEEVKHGGEAVGAVEAQTGQQRVPPPLPPPLQHRLTTCLPCSTQHWLTFAMLRSPQDWCCSVRDVVG